MSQEIIEKKIQTKNQTISPRELLLKYLHFLPWILLSLVIFLFIAFLKIRYSTPMYNVGGKIMIKNEDAPYSQGGEKFSEIFLMQGMSNNVLDEMEVISSRTIANRVIDKLGLEIKYYNKGKIRSSAIHFPDMPFEVVFKSIVDSTKPVMLNIGLLENSKFKIEDERTEYFYGQEVKNEKYSFYLKPRLNYTRRVAFPTNDFTIVWTPREEIANDLLQALQLMQPNKFGNIINLSFDVDNPYTGIDIVNTFMAEYQNAGLEEKRKTADNTLEFIENQLDTVAASLQNVEGSLLNFRQSNNIIDPVEQSKLFLNESSGFSSLQMQEEVKLKVVTQLIEYISNEKNNNRLVPSSLGFEDPSLLQKINEFNRITLLRESAAKTMPVTNPLIQEYDSTIENMKGDILQSLRTVKQAIEVGVADYRKKSNELNRELLSIPAKERRLLEVKRQQSLMQELYQYLMQKKLETSISSASTNSNIRIVESAVSDKKPVSPKPFQVYGLFFLAGLFIPIGIISAREFFNDTIQSRDEIERAIDMPILGEIGHSEFQETLVVTQRNRHFIAEQFRLIRTNIKYILPDVDKPVIMVTSSFSGEGKSFISSNIGAVFAMSGKRTVILEFDIRKPKIMTGLGVSSNLGITNYLVGNVQVQELIVAVPQQENLYVIPCGPLPPNPAEMLLHEKVEYLFEQLKKQFDVIIIDTAPIGLVSDAITLSKFTDATIYVVRHNYTNRKFLQLIDDLNKNKRIPKLSLLINDISKKGQGYYGYSYGYGYGYGGSNKTNGYFDDLKKKDKIKKKTRKLF